MMKWLTLLSIVVALAASTSAAATGQMKSTDWQKEMIKTINLYKPTTWKVGPYFDEVILLAGKLMANDQNFIVSFLIGQYNI